jgi:hypothetical protein
MIHMSAALASEMSAFLFCIGPGLDLRPDGGLSWSTYVPLESRDGSFGIAMGYGLDGRRIWFPGRDKGFFSSPQRPDQLWAPSSLLPNG